MSYDFSLAFADPGSPVPGRAEPLIGTETIPRAEPKLRQLPVLPLIGVTLAVATLVTSMRLLGFGHGPVAGAIPSAGVALAAGLRLGPAGAAAAALGFIVAVPLADLPIDHAVTLALSHGLAALVAGPAMKALSARRTTRSRTSDLFVFLAGATIFITVVAAVALLAAAVGWITLERPWRFVAVIALFEPLGIITVFPVIANAREWSEVVAHPGPIVPIMALGGVLTGILAYVLTATGAEVTAGAALVLSIPFCLWVAMQRRSLDGAAIALVASHAVLYLVLRDAGFDVLSPVFLLSTLYLNLLVATSQFVHVVNRDRLDALEEVAARKAELEVRVEQRTARLVEMTERARAADAAKTRLLATVSHEVRTPLNGVIGMASVVLAGRLDPGTRANVEIIRSSGFHLLDVTNRILDFSRLESGGEAEIVEFDLRALIEEVLAEARFLPFASGLVLSLDMAGGPAPRLGQRQGLRQVLTNLVGNALKFTDDGRVTVHVYETPGGLTRIEVEDTGSGVPPEARERIFRPYEQVESIAARRHGGSGLGLAISSEIVARMGGRIGLSGAAGQGSCFWIEVPLALSRAAPSPEPLRA